MRVIGFFWVALMLPACSEQNTTNSFKLEVNALEYFLFFPDVKPPLNSAEDAMKYAIHRPTILVSLQNAQRDAGYLRWVVTVNIRKDTYSPSWEVYINSSGKIPSFSCVTTFTFDGESISSSNGLSLNYCRYNK